MEFYGRSQPGSINLSTAPVPGGSHPCRPRGWLRRAWSSRGSGLVTEVPVAEPVVDQREQLTAGGDLGDVDTAVRTDAGPGGADRAAVDALHGLDRGPADQPVALPG